MDTPDTPHRTYRSGLIIGLILGLLSGVWLLNKPIAGTAQAQVPDAGAQRVELRRELSRLNTSMDELLKLLKSGKLKVICVPADVDTRSKRNETDRQTRPGIPKIGRPQAGGDAG